jgi:phosphohistidine phosphatase
LKTLFLIRHAKSSWDDIDISDFDRPLNKRGERDAPFISELLASKITSPQLIYSSPANRAFSTAKIFAKSFNYSIHEIVIAENIYEGSVSNIMNVIYKTTNDIDIIMMFGHNPGFTLVTNYLSNKQISNMPTCGAVQLNFNLNSWNEIEGNTGSLVLFEYPKKYLK